jgi:hypothetical protein
MAVYTCYKPANGISPSQLALKQEAFKKGYVTSHDPITGIWKDKSDSPDNKTFPFGKPVLSERGLKAAGMVPYWVEEICRRVWVSFLLYEIGKQIAIGL